VQVADVQELARDLVVIPDRHVQLVPNIGVIGGAHSAFPHIVPRASSHQGERPGLW
jgi:hypothetical protein